MLAITHAAYAAITFVSTIAVLLIFVSAVSSKRPE